MCVPDPRSVLVNYENPAPTTVYRGSPEEDKKRQQELLTRLGMSGLMRVMPKTSPVKIIRKVL
jgi:hypothetical protein